MAFKNLKSFTHSQEDKVGVLVTNLGTPEAPTASALRVYLKQFLSDPRVVEIPRLVWMIILHGIVLRIRPKKSAQAYQSVWTDAGSPLMIHTRNQAAALQERFVSLERDDVIVEYAMRYGQPAIDEKIQALLERGVRKLLVLPLYPQYSGSTTGSTFDAIAEDFKQRRWLPDFRFVASYHDHPDYLRAMANKIKAYWNEHGRADKLILSYHGVPKRYLEQGDPYYCHCQVTSRLLIDLLGLSEHEVMTTFQSRFGKAEWLKPYTDQTLKALPNEGVKSVQVFCPGFSADCLETLEEIAEENREYFMEAGGEKYDYIPALNADQEHIEALGTILDTNMLGWEKRDTNYSVRQQNYERSPMKVGS